MSQNLIRQIALALDPSAYLSPRDYLRALYEAAKSRAGDEGYSYLRMAEELGFSRTNVVRLMVVGERPLTVKAGETMAKALRLSGPARRYWTTLVRYVNERLPAERERLFSLMMGYRNQSAPRALDPLQLEYFSEWYHPVIREMAGLAGFDGDPAWVQARLGFPLRLEQVRRSLELLRGLGLIKIDPASGRTVRGNGVVATSGEVDSMAIVRYHQKMLEIARESITVVDEERRDIRAVTVSLPAHLIPVLKGKLEALVNEVAALEGEQSGDEVIQVNVQMFPFTKAEA
jgi:uncharacterized protein (TIGR02147 family)